MCSEDQQSFTSLYLAVMTPVYVLILLSIAK